jgi:hypothetical protein
MLPKLLFLLFTIVVLHADAQDTRKTPSKITEKQIGSEIDYKQIGAPLPSMRVIVYKDTASGDKINADNTAEKTKRKRKHKQETGTAQEQGILTNKDLDNGANLFLMIFNPTCSHCEEETIMIEKNFSMFQRSKLVLLATPVTQPYIGDFLVFTHLREHPEITVGVDSAGYLDKVFLYQTLPQINIYNSERRLIKTYSGEVTIDSLKQYIE